MWDNLNSELRAEFWDCGDEDDKTLAFMDGNVSFHFNTLYYNLAHRVTLKCMQTLTEVGGDTAHI